MKPMATYKRRIEDKLDPRPVYVYRKGGLKWAWLALVWTIAAWLIVAYLE